MAKRTGAGSMSAGGKRGGGRGSRVGGGRGQRAGGAGQIASAEPERMRGATGGGRRSSRQEDRGLLAGARDVALNIGETTAETARQFASTAKNAATSAAGRTQRTVSQAADKVRENPWPSLLIGAGVTWLAVDAIRGRSSESEGRGRKPREEESGPGLVRRTASTIADAGRGAGGYVRDAGEYVGEFVRERPLLAGAATLGIGMAVGLAMPSTSSEDSMMGNVRDNVVRRAKDAAKGTMDAVRDVADSVERMAGGGGRDRTR